MERPINIARKALLYLWHIFTIKPLAAVSIVLCLATILSCVTLERKRPHNGADRFLIAFLGLLSVYQAIRILHAAGIVHLSVNAKLDDAIDLSVAGFYLLATVMLRFATVNHLDAESAMRLVRAAPPRSQLRNPEMERDLARLTWALPRVSDGAFKLYAFLCLRQDPSSGVPETSSADVRLQLGKSKDELDRYLAELEEAGAVSITREGPNVGITIVAQPRQANLSATGDHVAVTPVTQSVA
jgi:hypothetical protein